MINTVITNKLTAPVQFTREEFTDVGADNFKLGLSAQNFLTGTDFEIWNDAVSVDPADQLVEGVDYELNYINWRVANAAGYEVKCYIKILTVGYQSGSIFITCKIAQTETDGELINAMLATDASLQAQISAISGSLPFPEISGIEIANDTTDANNDILFPAGFCYSSDFAYALVLATPLIKQLDAVFASGTNAGGLFSGSKAANTTYHMFLIRKDSDGSIDAGFDTDPDCANIPTGYTAYRWVMSALTDASGNWELFNFTRKNKTVKYVTKKVENNWQVPTSATLTTLLPSGVKVPTGIEVNPIGVFSAGSPADLNQLEFNIYSYDELPPAITSSASSGTSTFNGLVCIARTFDAGDKVFSNLQRFKTNTSGQLYFHKAYGTYYSASYYSTLQIDGYILFNL
jgi:hypothetical protein